MSVKISAQKVLRHRLESTVLGVFIYFMIGFMVTITQVDLPLWVVLGVAILNETGGYIDFKSHVHRLIEHEFLAVKRQ